jgi:hypothetical protein
MDILGEMETWKPGNQKTYLRDERLLDANGYLVSNMITKGKYRDIKRD